MGASQVASGAIIVRDPASTASHPPIVERVAVYARVSAKENRPHLEDQAERLVAYCAAKGYHVSDTPHGPRPGGFSGDACSNELRSRLKAVSPPTARMPSPRSRCFSSRTRISSHPHARKR